MKQPAVRVVFVVGVAFASLLGFLYAVGAVPQVHAEITSALETEPSHVVALLPDTLEGAYAPRSVGPASSLAVPARAPDVALSDAAAPDPFATVYIFVTGDGFKPEALTVSVGTMAVWTNAMTETVTVAGEGLEANRVYLPLVLRSAAGGVAAVSSVRDIGILGAGSQTAADVRGIALAPGESVFHIFTVADLYEYEVSGAVTGRGTIHVDPLQIDDPALAWATDPAGPILLRWRWPRYDEGTNALATQPSGYNVYRNGAKLNTTPITYVTGSAFTTTMGADWTWFQSTYTDVTSVAGFHTYLSDNPLAQHWLADQRHAIALTRGLGYLDDTAVAGVPYVYTVEGIVSGIPVGMGAVTVTNTGPTPVTPPTVVTATTVVSDGLRGSPDWPLAQRNRQAHGRLYLTWALPQPVVGDAPPEVWTTSYDIFRAGPVAPGQDPGSMAWSKLTVDEPVVPMPENKPQLYTTTLDTYGTLPYEEYDYFFADEVLTPCTTYAYRVAARDMLGQAGAASTWVTATVPDTMPPDAPDDIATIEDHIGGAIEITWTASADAASYTVYRADTPTAGWPGVSDCASTPCWVTMTTTGLTSWADWSGVYEHRYWYTVRAQDAPCGSHPPNVSAPSLAVAATLHDRVAPGDPNVYANPDGPEIIIDPNPDGDTTYSLLYCKFDEDPTDGYDPPMVLISEVPTTTTTFDLSAYYSAGLPISVTCWAQPVDANGNRGNLVEVDRAVNVCPTNAYTLTTPTIDAVLTEQGGTYGWTAVLTWSVDAQLPQSRGYRIYRQEGTGALTDVTHLMGGPVLDKTERTFRDDSVKPGEVYSYVLAAIIGSCGTEFPVEGEVWSGPRLYTIRPTLDTPDLDPCVRPLADIGWDARPQELPQGIYMRWQHPYGDVEHMLTVVYRSREKDGDYVAITPPYATITGEYLDAQAQDTEFWYIATVLNWATGEIVYRTPPTSVVGSGLTMAPQISLPDEPPQRPTRASAVAAPSLPGAVDASPDTFEAAADTVVLEENPSTNYGGEAYVSVAHSTEVIDGERRAYARFDISSIPNGSIIDHAEFGAHVDAFIVTPQGEPVDVGLRAAQASWDESSITWSNQPALGAGVVTRTVITDSQWITWTITELASHWYQNPAQNYGFGLASAQVLDHQVYFPSREGPDNHPRLVVHYFEPPEVLWFGIAGGNAFMVDDLSYAPGSTPDCATGQGTVTLGGGDLGATYPRIAAFSCIEVDYGSGNVISGTAAVNLQGTIQLAHTGGFSYTVSTLALDEYGGYGDIDLALPRDAALQFMGTTLNPVPLTTATIRQDLRFLHLRPSWIGSCSDVTPDFAFAMEPLPLLVVPTAGVTITEMHVELGLPCTRYADRYNGARPAFPVADSNDGFLRPNYQAIQPTFIFAGGVSGGFNTKAPVSYTTGMPYGFEISVTDGITIELHGNRIDNGQMAGVSVGLDYYRRPAGKVVTATLGELPPLDGRIDGEAPVLHIGPDGELIGDVWSGVWGTAAMSVTWGGGGFRLDDEIYLLYVPPVQTNAGVWPSEQAAASSSLWDRIQAGLNRVALDPDSAAFTWKCCTSGEAVGFPDGVDADIYLRRGGVSDLIVARLAYPGLPTSIYNYDTMVTSFGLSFCDNAIYDSDVAGDVDLSYPADVTIPLVDMVLDPNTACVKSGKVNTSKLTLAHWDVDIGPRRVEFRPQAPPADEPTSWTAVLWILGTMDVPHVAAIQGGSTAAAVPLESSWKYDGTFLAAKVVQDKVNYTFDGFHYLFRTLSLSTYPPAPSEPRWTSMATLAEPPTVISGFVTLQGNVLAPSYGTVVEEVTKKPPDLFVLGWDDYVGFSAVPYAERRWTELAGLTWGFDLLYVQHYTSTVPRGAFVGFRNDDIFVAELDQALVLSSWDTTPRTDLLLGLSAGTGALRAIAETTVPSLGALDATLVTSMTTWAGKLGCSTQYVNFLQAEIKNKTLWSQYTSSKGYGDTTELMDKWSDGQEKNIPTTPVGGGTTGVVSDLGVEFNKMRGVISWDTDATTGDSHFEELEISLWLNIQQPGDDDPMVHADYIHFSADRDGDYVLIGEKIKVELYEYKLPKIDIYIGINVDKPTFEGNVAIYKLEIEGLILEKAAAIIGVGSDLFYVGALVHDAHPKYSDTYKLGGAILLGRIDPTSKVLQAGSFGSILKDIGATGGTLTQGILNGAYVRVYGQFPLYDYGCVFRVKAGGEIAGWYFATDTGCDAYGGRLRANITGKLLCVVSGRGDMTLQVYRKVLPGSACAENASFKGQFWVAGGIGFCDPDSWKSWASRWWGDSWCWTAGAMVEADYNDSKADGWNWNYDGDYE